MLIDFSDGVVQTERWKEEGERKKRGGLFSLAVRLRHCSLHFSLRFSGFSCVCDWIYYIWIEWKSAKF